MEQPDENTCIFYLFKYIDYKRKFNFSFNSKYCQNTKITSFDFLQIHQAVIDLDAEVTTDLESEDETSNVKTRKSKTAEDFFKGTFDTFVRK